MISIIIPTLNEEKIIDQTLLALKKLIDFNYEIIVSDGRSTDKTVEIAKKYTNKIIVHDGATQQNISKNRNAGAKVAQGEYLVFIDADVVIPDINNFFIKALSLFEERKNLIGLSVFLKVFPEMATFFDKLFFHIININHCIRNNVLHRGAASGKFQMIRADIFKKTNGYNKKFPAGEDQELFLRLSRLGRTYIEPSLYVFHTSRRAHEIGWLKLLFLWLRNDLYILFFKRSYDSEWKAIR